MPDRERNTGQIGRNSTDCSGTRILNLLWIHSTWWMLYLFICVAIPGYLKPGNIKKRGLIHHFQGWKLAWHVLYAWGSPSSTTLLLSCKERPWDPQTSNPEHLKYDHMPKHEADKWGSPSNSLRKASKKHFIRSCPSPGAFYQAYLSKSSYSGISTLVNKLLAHTSSESTLTPGYSRCLQCWTLA